MYRMAVNYKFQVNAIVGKLSGASRTLKLVHFWPVLVPADMCANDVVYHQT